MRNPIVLLLGLILLVTLSGCLRPSMDAQVDLDEINCTSSEVSVSIKVSGPMAVTLFTSEGEKTFQVDDEFDYRYLVDNQNGYERVLITTEKGHEFQRVLGLPECACLLFYSQREWDGSNLIFQLTAIQDADINVRVGDQLKEAKLLGGENTTLSFPLSVSKTTMINVTITAQGWCTQESKSSILLEKYQVNRGKVEYKVGETVKVHKEFEIEGVLGDFMVLVGGASNLTVDSDGKTAEFQRRGTTIMIKEPFQKLTLDYTLVPDQQGGRLQFLDQVMSFDSVSPVPVTVEFDPAYAPYLLNYTEFTVSGTDPITFSTTAGSYKKVVNILYGPRKVRIQLDLYPVIFALNDTRVQVEALVPKNTPRQTIERVLFEPEPEDSRQIDGDEFKLYDFDMKKGENKTIHIRVDAVREVGLYPEIGETIAPSSGNVYWRIDDTIREAAQSLKGATAKETVVNVVEFVKSRTTYEDNDERIGAIQTFYTKRGACDEYTDLDIALLRELGVYAAYVSGYSVETSGGSPPGSHSWVKIVTGDGVEIEPQEGVGALDPYRLEFYTEYGKEKSRYWVYGDVTFMEQAISRYEMVQ